MAKLKKRPQHRKSSPQDLVTFADTGADPVARANAIANLTSDGFRDLEPQFAACLSDPDPSVRGQAVQSLLGFWHLAGYFGEAARILREDPMGSARDDAFDALAMSAQFGTQADFDATLPELVRALLRAEGANRQGDFYERIVGLLRPDAGYEAPYPFDWERDVDQALIAPYLPDGQPGSRSRG